MGMPMEGIGLMWSQKGATDGELARGPLLCLCGHEGCFDVLVVFRRDGMMVASAPDSHLCCGEVGRWELVMKDISGLEDDVFQGFHGAFSTAGDDDVAQGFGGKTSFGVCEVVL